MTVRIDYRKPGIGKYLEVDETGWVAEVFGILDISSRGELEPGAIEELEEKSEDLDYSNSLGTLDRFVQKFYGGFIETSEGRREWKGPIPADAREYLQEVRKALD